jgi:hypothetical protein
MVLSREPVQIGSSREQRSYAIAYVADHDLLTIGGTGPNGPQAAFCPSPLMPIRTAVRVRRQACSLQRIETEK